MKIVFIGGFAVLVDKLICLRRELTWSILPDVIWLIFDLDTQYFAIILWGTL